MKKKRTYIMVDCSEEYKTELRRLITEKFNDAKLPVNADRIMGPEVRRVLEQEYPSLRSVAAKDN